MEFEAENWTISIDHELCTGCQECLFNCPAEVFEIKEEKSYATQVENCLECCACPVNCPEGAITHTLC